MKRLILLVFIAQQATVTSIAQSGNRKQKSNESGNDTITRPIQPVKQPGNNNWIDDSLLWIKKPVSVTTDNSKKTDTQPIKQQGNNNWIDDSLLWIKKPVSVTTDNSKKTATQQIKQQGNNNWIDDSLLWIKNPSNKNIANSENTSNRINKPVNKTKLDDLKNPFDTTKTKQIKTVRQ